MFCHSIKVKTILLLKILSSNLKTEYDFFIEQKQAIGYNDNKYKYNNTVHLLHWKLNENLVR